MKVFLLMLVAGLVPAWLATSSGDAKEPEPTVDAVLAKWEEASQKCQTLDAKLTVFRYDTVFGGREPTITQGRFYYEAPDRGRYEIRKTARGASNDWRNISEAVVWTGKETLWIEGDRRRCQKCPTEKLRSLSAPPEGKKEGWLAGIFSAFGRQLARRLQGPRQFHPLLIGIPAAEVRERFDVTLEKSGEEILLKAVPKRQADQAGFREIDVILDAKTYMTMATQEVLPNGRDRMVFQVSELKVNQRPSDRDQLLAPDLSGLRVIDADAFFLVPEELK